MILDQKVVIPAPPERVWDLMMDVPAVASCMPGAESIEKINEDEYIGTLRIRIGKIAVRLEGKITVVDRNRDEWSAGMKVEAIDRKIRGSVAAKSTMTLHPQGNGATELAVHADASILGKLGEFGQAVMRRKADQIVGEFARNVARKIEAGGVDAAPTAAPPTAAAAEPAQPMAAAVPARPAGRWRGMFRRLRLRLRSVLRRA